MDHYQTGYFINTIHTNIKMTSPKNELMKIFDEPTFAWELLEWEIAIEMNESLSGQAIAKLLELYMRGVQKMNSLMDIREAYFKNKVQSLMMKNNVVKTLNKPPMAKKQKPLEVTAKVEGKKTIKVKQEIASNKKVDNLQPVVESKPVVNTFALQEKKREIEMRLAYQAHQSSRENLNNIYNQHLRKEENFTIKVKTILNDHQQRLKERITRRKLRTATYRSRPQDTSDTFPIEENSAEKKEYQINFSPSQNGKHKKKENNKKRHSSLRNKVNHDLTIEQSPRKFRKSFYIQPTAKLIEQKETEIEKKQQNQYDKLEYQQVEIKPKQKNETAQQSP